MEEVGKLPLKRVELSLTKFNEVAIPHHLDLLRQHKANIIKFGEHGDGARVRSEQTHARRVAAQLRALLHEMDALRRQVRPEDWDRFDALTQRSRDLTLRAIVDYLESSPVTIRRTGGGVGGVGGEGVGEVVCGSAVSTESVGVVAHAPQLQLQHDDQELQLKEREEVLRGWCELQAEVHALHESWRLMQDAAVLQRQQVTTASESIEVAADNVQEARRSLSIAERLGAGAAALCGACAGAACGGPLGLLAGAKAAAAAALAGAALGYAAVRAVRRLPPALPPAAPNHDKIL